MPHRRADEGPAAAPPRLRLPHTRAAAVMLLTVGLAGCGSLSGCTAPPSEGTASPSVGTSPPSLGNPTTFAADLEAGVNAARVAEGLPELAHADCAVELAAERAADLVGNPDLPHAPMDAVLAGCGVGVAGENLSRATLPAGDVVDAWLGSPGHRSNILDTQFWASGVACLPDGEALVCSHVFLGD